MSYDVVLDTEAADYLEKEDTSVSERILKSLWKLKEKPTSYGKPLRGVQLWVLRGGDYRVIYKHIYNIDNNNERVEVLLIGHRKNIYRQL